MRITVFLFAVAAVVLGCLWQSNLVVARSLRSEAEESQALVAGDSVEVNDPRQDARVWVMKHLAALVKVAVDDEHKAKKITTVKASMLHNLDDTETQTMRALINTILTKADSSGGTPTGENVKSILERQKGKIQNTKYGNSNSICKAAGVLKKGVAEEPLHCDVNVYQLLLGVTLEDRCAKTTETDVLKLIQSYYQVGVVFKNYKAAIDASTFQAAVDVIYNRTCSTAPLIGLRAHAQGRLHSTAIIALALSCPVVSCPFFASMCFKHQGVCVGCPKLHIDGVGLWFCLLLL